MRREAVRLGIIPACGALRLAVAASAPGGPVASPGHACAGLLGTPIENTVITLRRPNPAHGDDHPRFGR